MFVNAHAPRPVCERLERRTLLNAGDFDATFGGGDGMARLSFPGRSFTVHDVAVQADRKVVAAGTRFRTAAVARLNADGSVDTTFGQAGLTELSGRSIQVFSGVALQLDGGIIVVGHDLPLTSVVVARLLPDGALDAAFGSGGVVMTRIGDSAGGTDVAIQNDGKIVVAGTARTGTINNNNDFVVVRYHPNGSLDTSFGAGGIRLAGFDGEEFVTALAIDYNGNFQSNPWYGTIAVVGIQGFPEGEPRDTSFAVARLTPGGAFDNSFDGNGRLITRFPGGVSDARGVVIQPGGKIVAVGSKRFPGKRGIDHVFAMVRYLPNGALDTAFGSDGTGRVETDFGGVSSDRAYDVAPGHLGGLLVTGVSSGKLAVAAYTRDGVLDSRFDRDGLVTTTFPAGSAAIALSSGRKFVIAGSDGHVARLVDVGSLITMGSLDTTAAEGGGNPASFIVARTERLPYAERIFLEVSGTATRPRNFRNRPPDYDTVGMTFGMEFSTEPTYADIPANETFTVMTINPREDTAAEGDETAVFSIAPYEFYDIDTARRVTLVIADNEAPPPAQVVGRHIFYDRSAYDAISDDAAIATDKRALIPGEMASFANVSSYSKGINGVMVDISNTLDNGGLINAATFAFHAGSSKNPAGWPAAPPPTFLQVRPNAGVNGSDRVVIAWPAGAIRNRWLRVTVMAHPSTRLTAPDLFYFGSLIGETGDTEIVNGENRLRVSPTDVVTVRRALHAPAPITSLADVNRDGRINALDLEVVRRAVDRSLSRPLALHAPASGLEIRHPAWEIGLVETGTRPAVWHVGVRTSYNAA